jgi:NitT/TauT family transport system ATP-binding protein
MKMRVSLARALAKRPPVLLMDEPFAALDELTRFRLDDDLRAIWQRQNCTIVFVTHSVTEAAYLAERALVMQAGEIKSEIAIDQTDRADDFRSAPPYIAACAALSQALGHKRAAAK